MSLMVGFNPIEALQFGVNLGDMKAHLIFPHFRKMQSPSNKTSYRLGPFKIILGLALIATFYGCVGWVDNGGSYSGGVIVSEPYYSFYDGGYGGGYEYRNYSHRGYASRSHSHQGRHR
ncbi:MAG: hypothetical protein V4507_13165 [Verrucomicrobiota bacterium]